MKKKIFFGLLLGLILYPANKVTNYNISNINYNEGNEISNQIDVEWQKNWGGIQKKCGGSIFAEFNSIIEIQDGYVVVGETSSDDIEGLTNKGDSDAIIIKYDKNGNIIWQKTWGGIHSDGFNSIIEVQDGYVVVGKTGSLDIEGLNYIGYIDAIIIKYDKNGNIIWQKNWGGSGVDEFYSVFETQDGYVVVGETNSSNIEELTNKGYYDAIIIKYDKNGNMIWQKTWGGSGLDEFYSAFETQDGYVVVGETNSSDIEGLNNKVNYYDAIIIKYDKNGNIIWQKNWGSSGADEFYSAFETQDGYVVVGSTSSDDAIIIKYDKNGNIIWQKTWGGIYSDVFNSIIEVQDGYVVAGYTNSSDIEGLNNRDSDDAIIVKYDKNGNIIWQKAWNSIDDDKFNSIVETRDGYVAVGYTIFDDVDDYCGDAIIIKYKLFNTIDTSNNNEVLDSNSENSNDNVSTENISNNSSTNNTNTNQETVVDAPNTLSFISKILLIASGLLIIFGIGLYGYNLYKLNKQNNK